MGATATHFDDILERGEPDLLSKARGSLETRFGKLKVQEGPVVRVGVGMAQEKDFSVTLAQEDFTKNLEVLPTSPA